MSHFGGSALVGCVAASHGPSIWTVRVWGGRDGMLIRHFAFFYYLCYFNSGYWCSIFTSRADCEIKGRVIRVGRGGGTIREYYVVVLYVRRMFARVFASVL